jgi:hypothetical protein
MRYRCALLALLLLLPSAAAAQRPGPVAVPSPSFESWEPGGGSHRAFQRNVLVAGSKDRTRNALLGGAIGALAGVTFCTVVSNLVKDEGTGFSTCTTSGYLLTGGVGLALGLLVGLAV